MLSEVDNTSHTYWIYGRFSVSSPPNPVMKLKKCKLYGVHKKQHWLPVLIVRLNICFCIFSIAKSITGNPCVSHRGFESRLVPEVSTQIWTVCCWADLVICTFSGDPGQRGHWKTCFVIGQSCFNSSWTTKAQRERLPLNSRCAVGESALFFFSQEAE